MTRKDASELVARELRDVMFHHSYATVRWAITVAHALTVLTGSYHSVVNVRDDGWRVVTS